MSGDDRLPQLPSGSPRPGSQLHQERWPDDLWARSHGEPMLSLLCAEHVIALKGRINGGTWCLVCLPEGSGALTGVITAACGQTNGSSPSTYQLLALHPDPAHLPQGYRRPNYKELATDQARYQRWLLKHECKAFYTPVFAEDLKQGAQYLLQVGTLLEQPGRVVRGSSICP